MTLDDLNPYDELGVQRDATEQLIRSAYREKAKTAHPDGGGTEEAFDRLRTALVVLTSPAKRKAFDDTGRIEEDRPDNDRVTALSIIDQQVGTLINAYITSGFTPENDPRYLDMPTVIASNIRDEIAKIKDGIVGGEKVVALLLDIKRRFALKEPSEHENADPIRRGIELQIKQAEAQLANLRVGVRVHELAIPIAQAYVFEFDAVPMPEPKGFSPEFFTTTGFPPGYFDRR